MSCRWVLPVSLSLARDSASEGSENRGVMPTQSSDGQLGAAISTGVVHVLSEHTGRGPTKARTVLDGDVVVVILHDSMTKAERTLVDAGKDAEVMRLRRTYQETMEQDLVAVVERLTERRVVAFMSANHIAPDAAAEVFLLDGAATD